MAMKIRKKIKVEVEGSTFYFKPLTMKEAMARKELADTLESGGNISEMGDSIADLLIGWDGVEDEEGNAVPFEAGTYKEVFTNSFSVFQVVEIIKAYLKEIGWTGDEEGSLPNE
jgi:hypothetical protein